MRRPKTSPYVKFSMRSTISRAQPLARSLLQRCANWWTAAAGVVGAVRRPIRRAGAFNRAFDLREVVYFDSPRWLWPTASGGPNADDLRADRPFIVQRNINENLHPVILDRDQGGRADRHLE